MNPLTQSVFRGQRDLRGSSQPVIASLPADPAAPRLRQAGLPRAFQREPVRQYRDPDSFLPFIRRVSKNSPNPMIGADPVRCLSE